MVRTTNGTAIRAIREALGISQKDLAQRASITPSHLCKAEAGECRMSPAAMRRTADALGVPMDAISHVVPEPEKAVS